MKTQLERFLTSHVYRCYSSIKKSVSCVTDIALRSLNQEMATKPTCDPFIWATKIDTLKDKQQNHLTTLAALARAGQWQHLQTHTDHPDSGFDWWMFPIDRTSAGYGNQYQVSQSEIEALMKDPIFMKNYRAGVILVAKSWGWDLERRKDVTNKVQKWTNYQVRLGKMLDSLRLFKQDDLRMAITDFIDQKGLRPSLEPWIQRLLFKSHN